MKKLLPLLPLLLLIVSCSKPIDEESLVQRNGVYYKVNSETPYSGKSLSFHDNEKKKREVNYKDGKLDGLETNWYENGQKRNEKTFMGGKRMSETNWSENGHKLSQWSSMIGSVDVLETKWYENGNKNYEKTFKDGSLISKKEWYEDGTKMTVSYTHLPSPRDS